MENIDEGNLNNGESENSEGITFEELAAQVYLIRQAAMKQVVYGLLWWGGSAVAMFFALQSTGDTFYYFGGALGSLFHWYRAIKMYLATKEVGASNLLPAEKALVGGAILAVLITSATIVPTYFKVSSPTVGTCWADSETENMMAPVACWGGNAVVKAVALVDSTDDCPAEATGYFDPSYRESQYTCLIDN